MARSSWLLLCILSFFIVLFVAQLVDTDVVSSATPSQPQVGRYQLFQGYFVTLDAKNNRSDEDKAVFLLDTATGKVKRYSTGMFKDGTLFEGWDETEREHVKP